MADINDLANQLFGRNRRSSSSDSTETATIYGKAVSDSYNGTVKVQIDGQTSNVDSKPHQWGDYSGTEWGEMAGYSWATLENGNGNIVELPTSPVVKNGDSVIITLVGTPVMKRPYVSAVIGSGDRSESEIDAKLEEQEKQTEKSLEERVDEALTPFRKDYENFIKNHSWTDSEITKTFQDIVNGSISQIHGQHIENNIAYTADLTSKETIDEISKQLSNEFVSTNDDGYKYISQNYSSVQQTVNEVNSTVSGHENLSDAIESKADTISSTKVTQTKKDVQTVITSIVAGNDTYKDLNGDDQTNSLGEKVIEIQTYITADTNGLRVRSSETSDLSVLVGTKTFSIQGKGTVNGAKNWSDMLTFGGYPTITSGDGWHSISIGQPIGYPALEFMSTSNSYGTSSPTFHVAEQGNGRGWPSIKNEYKDADYSGDYTYDSYVISQRTIYYSSEGTNQDIEFNECYTPICLIGFIIEYEGNIFNNIVNEARFVGKKQLNTQADYVRLDVDWYDGSKYQKNWGAWRLNGDKFEKIGYAGHLYFDGTWYHKEDATSDNDIIVTRILGIYSTPNTRTLNSE